MFGVGTGELVLIMVIAMLVVGPERVVEFAAQLGQMIAKFRRETESITSEFRDAFSLDSANEVSAQPDAVGPPKALGQLPSGSSDASPAEAVVPEGAASVDGAGSEVTEATPDEEELASARELEHLAAMFVDSEGEISAPVSRTDDEAASAGSAPADAEPILISVAQLVPKDRDVEPTIIEEPQMILEETAVVEEPAHEDEGRPNG